MNDNAPIHTPDSHIQTRFGGGKPALLGAIAGIALLAGWSVLRTRRRSRRYADHALERRTPLSMFAGGDHPRRRIIDYSGSHPLFERRQSVYDAY